MLFIFTVEQGRERLSGLESEYPSDWMRGLGLSRAEAVERISRFIESRIQKEG